MKIVEVLREYDISTTPRAYAGFSGPQQPPPSIIAAGPAAIADWHTRMQAVGPQTRSITLPPHRPMPAVPPRKPMPPSRMPVAPGGANLGAAPRPAIGGVPDRTEDRNLSPPQIQAARGTPLQRQGLFGTNAPPLPSMAGKNGYASAPDPRALAANTQNAAQNLGLAGSQKPFAPAPAPTSNLVVGGALKNAVAQAAQQSSMNLPTRNALTAPVQAPQPSGGFSTVRGGTGPTRVPSEKPVPAPAASPPEPFIGV